jgi:hypothetical protein
MGVGGVLYIRKIAGHWYLGTIPSTSVKVLEKQGSDISRYKVQLSEIVEISAGQSGRGCASP